MRPGLAFQQIKFLMFELKRLVNRHYHRWFIMWFGGSACVLVSYRIDRAIYLLLGNIYSLLRPFLFPIFLTLRILSAKHEISYKADIGKGLNILHPSLGIVISAKIISGSNLTLTGGELHWRTQLHAKG